MSALTPSRVAGSAGGVGVASAVGAVGAVVHPFELIKSCVVAVTQDEKLMESCAGVFAFDAVSTGGAGGGGSSTGSCAMTMATPTPVRGGVYTPLRGAGSGAITPRDGGGGGVVGAGVAGAAENGLCVRVEDGLTAFLVLAMGILR